MSPTGQAKVCASCGADVSTAERMKDAKGRYICIPCVDKLRARKRAEAGGVAAGVAAAAPSSDQGADLRHFMAQAKQAAQNQCPSCGAFAQPGAVICVNCGYDARSQAQIQTKFGTARAAKGGGGGGGGGRGLGIALPESGTVIGLIAFAYFLFAVALPIVDVFVLQLGLIALSFSVVFIVSFVLWIFAIIGFMRRVDNVFVTVIVVLLSLTVWPLSALIAMVYGAFFAESRALRWFSGVNILGFAVCMGLVIYSLVTDTPMMSE